MPEKRKGKLLVSDTRKGKLELSQLISNPGVEDIHFAAISGTMAADERFTNYATLREFIQSDQVGYRGYVPIKGVTHLPQTQQDLFVSGLIFDKREGKEWSSERIGRLVHGHVAGEITNQHMAATLGMIMVKGMTDDEGVALTKAMWESGETLTFPGKKTKVDKHSTGGIGDKVSLVLAPSVVVANPDVVVPMISGRGLGHTGGTLDKLESIYRFSVDQTEDSIVQIIGNVGVVICGQTDNLAPADRKLYRLRDLTNCVRDPNLIKGSILSKKLAAGLDILVMDTKVGDGAFFKIEAAARDFARGIISVGYQNGLNTSSVLSNMDQPIGHYAGNLIEVVGAVEILTGRHLKSGYFNRFMGVVAAVSDQMLREVDPSHSGVDFTKLFTPDDSGYSPAFKKFQDMAVAQGADSLYLADLVGRIQEQGTLMDLAKGRDYDGVKRVMNPEGDLVPYEVKASSSGYLNRMDLEDIGKQIGALGAGRANEGDQINPDPGVIFTSELGDRVTKGDVLAVVLYDGKKGEPEAFGQYFHVEGERVEPQPLLMESMYHS